MLYHVISFCLILYYLISYIIYHIVSYNIIWYHIIWCDTMSYYSILFILYAYVSLSLSVYIYIPMYMYKYICMNIYIYIYIYACIYYVHVSTFLLGAALAVPPFRWAGAWLGLHSGWIVPWHQISSHGIWTLGALSVSLDWFKKHI